MDLTTEQLDRAGALLVRARPTQEGADLSTHDEVSPEDDLAEAREVAQEVAEALWPGWMGQPRQPLPSGYRALVEDDGPGVDRDERYRWTLRTPRGTLVAQGTGERSPEAAAFAARTVLGVDLT